MEIFILVFSSIFLIATILPVIRTGAWWVRIFDYPRIQIAFFLSVSVLLVLIQFGWDNYKGFLLLTGLLIASFINWV